MGEILSPPGAEGGAPEPGETPAKRLTRTQLGQIAENPSEQNSDLLLAQLRKNSLNPEEVTTKDVGETFADYLRTLDALGRADGKERRRIRTELQALEGTMRDAGLQPEPAAPDPAAATQDPAETTPPAPARSTELPHEPRAPGPAVAESPAEATPAAERSPSAEAHPPATREHLDTIARDPSGGNLLAIRKHLGITSEEARQKFADYVAARATFTNPNADIATKMGIISTLERLEAELLRARLTLEPAQPEPTPVAEPLPAPDTDPSSTADSSPIALVPPRGDPNPSGTPVPEPIPPAAPPVPDEPHAQATRPTPSVPVKRNTPPPSPPVPITPVTDTGEQQNPDTSWAPYIPNPQPASPPDFLGLDHVINSPDFPYLSPPAPSLVPNPDHPVPPPISPEPQRPLSPAPRTPSDADSGWPYSPLRRPQAPPMPPAPTSHTDGVGVPPPDAKVRKNPPRKRGTRFRNIVEWVGGIGEK